MLDQNTDRMWFVIGALVVGAGVILLVNGTLPDVFANVTKSFKDVSEEGSNSVKNLSIYQNLIPPELANKTYGSVREHKPEFTSIVDFAPYIDARSIDQRYTLRFEAKSLDTSKYQTALVYMQNGSTSRYSIHFADGKSANKYISITEDWQTFEFNDIYFKRSSTFNKDDKAMFALYGVYNTGNIPLVKNIALIPTN